MRRMGDGKEKGEDNIVEGWVRKDMVGRGE